MCTSLYKLITECLLAGYICLRFLHFQVEIHSIKVIVAIRLVLSVALYVLVRTALEETLYNCYDVLSALSYARAQVFVQKY